MLWICPAGHTRVVRIPDCVPFRVTTNACRGFCLSYAIPSPMETTSYNPDYVITSRAECCSIFDTLDVRENIPRDYDNESRRKFYLSVCVHARACAWVSVDVVCLCVWDRKLCVFEKVFLCVCVSAPAWVCVWDERVIAAESQHGPRGREPVRAPRNRNRK